MEWAKPVETAIPASDQVRRARHLTPREFRRKLSNDLERARALVSAFPVATWLGLLVTVSTAFLISFGRRIPAPWLFPDELIYSELGRSFADTARFAIRDVPDAGYGVVYPLLLAPVYALLDSTVDAYVAAKVLNAVLMSLAAIPAYLLARRVLPRGWSFAAAILALAVPSTAYSGLVMTESVFYPLFLVSVLAIVLALERPTAWRQAAAVASIGLAFLTRAQAVALVAGLVAAAVILSVPEPTDTRRYLRAFVRNLDAFRVTWLTLAAGTLALPAIAVLRGGSPLNVFGAYWAAIERFSLSGLPRWTLYHAAGLDLYLGVIPFAAFLVMMPLALRRCETRRIRALAAGSIAIVLSMTFLVSAFATLPDANVALVRERNLFYVAPLFFTWFMVWIDRKLPRPLPLALSAGIVAAVLPGLLPFEKLVVYSSGATLAFAPWVNGLLRWEHVPLAMTVVAAMHAAVFLRTRSGIVALTVVLLGFYVVGTAARFQLERDAIRVSRLVDTRDADWIDRAVGPGADVSALWWSEVGTSRRPQVYRERAIWQSEYFNRSVRRVLYLDVPLQDSLPATPLRYDQRSRSLVELDGRQLRAAFVLVDEDIELQGRLVTRNAETELALYRIDGVVKVRAFRDAALRARAGRAQPVLPRRA